MALSFEAVWSAGCRLVNSLPASHHSGEDTPCSFQFTFPLDGMTTEKASGKLLLNSQWLVFFDWPGIWIWEGSERCDGQFSLLNGFNSGS